VFSSNAESENYPDFIITKDSPDVYHNKTIAALLQSKSVFGRVILQYEKAINALVLAIYRSSSRGNLR